MDRESNLSRFFQSDGRTVILPIDHGTAIPVPGLEDPIGLIEALNPIVDGYVVNLGIALAAADALEGKGICLRTDLNTASLEELVSTGLRESLADAAIRMRPFKTVAEIENVRGIGPVTLKKVSPYLKVALPASSSE